MKRNSKFKMCKMLVVVAIFSFSWFFSSVVFAQDNLQLLQDTLFAESLAQKERLQSMVGEPRQQRVSDVSRARERSRGVRQSEQVLRYPQGEVSYQPVVRQQVSSQFQGVRQGQLVYDPRSYDVSAPVAQYQSQGGGYSQVRSPYGAIEGQQPVLSYASQEASRVQQLKKAQSALLRRAQEKMRAGSFSSALSDVDAVLLNEPGNRRAVQMRTKIVSKIEAERDVLRRKREELVAQRAALAQKQQIGVLMRDAQTMYEVRNYYGALRALNELLAMDVNNVGAQQFKGRILEGLEVKSPQRVPIMHSEKQEVPHVEKKSVSDVRPVVRDREAVRDERISQLLEKANECYKVDDFYGAYKNINQVFRLDPSHVDAVKLQEKVARAAEKHRLRKERELRKKDKEVVTRGKENVIAQGVSSDVREEVSIPKASLDLVGGPGDDKRNHEVVEQSDVLDQSISQEMYAQAVAVAGVEEKARMGKGNVSRAMAQAKIEYERKAYDDALFSLNQVLIWDPLHQEAMDFKNAILQERREYYGSEYVKKRKMKAEIFRDYQNPQEEVLSEGDMQELRRLELAQEEVAVKEDMARLKRAEDQIRDDVRQRIVVEERELLEDLIKDVDASKFYEKFKAYDRKKEQQENAEKRKVSSLLLRADGLIEMQKYEEAIVYVNNVFMVEPYNVRAQKMREIIEGELFKKRQRNEKLAEKTFREEQKQYRKIRKQVREEKLQSLLDASHEYYVQEDYLAARQWAQKAQLVDPSNGGVKRWLRKIDKKLVVVQREIEEDARRQEGRRSGAIEEAAQEAARTIETQLIQVRQDEESVAERIRLLLAEANKKIRVDADYDGALVDLNRAFALDEMNETVVSKIQEVRELRKEQQREVREAGRGVGEDSEKKKAEADKIVLAADELAEREREEAQAKQEEKERKLKEYAQGTQILKTAAKKSYHKKARRAIKAAEKNIAQGDFVSAKNDIKQVFFFDPDNPTAKELMKEIADMEVQQKTGKVSVEYVDEAFKQGIEIEKVEQVLRKKRAEKDLVRLPDEVKGEDRKIEDKAVRILFKEGKSLLRKKRYYEAINKFEAIFAIDANNKLASQYIDKAKEAMVKEKEETRRTIEKEQQEERGKKLDGYSRKVMKLHGQGRYTEAAIEIEKALLVDPANEYLRELKKINQKGQTEQMYHEATPEAEVNNLINLGVKEYIQGNYRKAREYFEKVLRVNPSDVRAKNSIKKIDAKIESLNL